MNDRHLNDDQITEYALALMNEADLEEARAHLSSCDACSDLLNSTERVLGLAAQPQVPQADAKQVEDSWRAILDEVAPQAEADLPNLAVGDSLGIGGQRIGASDDGERDRSKSRWSDWLLPAFGGMPQWSWQMAQIVILAGLGFAAAWYLAGQGWLPGTQQTPDLAQQGRSPSVESTRDWLAANDYTQQLEVLLLDLARGEDPSGTSLTPAVKDVSRELLTDARWYRRAADRAGDPVLVDLLSEIEIVLLAVATVPEGQEDDLVEILRDLIDDQDLLWRLRSVRKDEATRPGSEVSTLGSSG